MEWNKFIQLVVGLMDQSAAFNVIQKNVLGNSWFHQVSYLPHKKLTSWLTNSALPHLWSWERSALGPCLYSLGQICILVVLSIVK